MRGEIAFADECRQGGPVDGANGRGGVEQPAQFIGPRERAHGIGHATFRHIARTHELREFKATTQRFDGRRHGERERLRPPHIRIVLKVAERTDRREQRRAAQTFRESIDEAARGAPVGQEDDAVGEGERIVRRQCVHDRIHQRVEKRR
ncbi:MAG: hypothetical protein FD124_2546 [Alphaproteobacteria bacterium]|nr:MAG: hypothetical protein FD124_2546 [Alphaproteobacteria bacterium]